MNKSLLLESIRKHEGLSLLHEEWRVIREFPDYQVSNHGRVKSITSRKGSKACVNGGILRGQIQEMTGGYKRVLVSLRKDKKTHQKKVHALVLSEFVGDRPDGMVALHIDGDALNNSVSNLKWGTPKENTADSIRHGTKTNPPIHSGESHPNATISDEDIRKIRQHKFERGDQARMAKMYGVADITISRIRKGVSRAAA